MGVIDKRTTAGSDEGDRADQTALCRIEQRCRCRGRYTIEIPGTA